MGKLLHKLVNGIVPSWFTKVKTSDNSPKKLLPFFRGGSNGSEKKSFPVSYPSNTELMGLLADDHESSYGSDEDTELASKFSMNSYTAPNSSPTSVVSTPATIKHNGASTMKTTKDHTNSPRHHRRKLSSHIIDEEKQQEKEDNHGDLHHKRSNKKHGREDAEKRLLRHIDKGTDNNYEELHRHHNHDKHDYKNSGKRGGLQCRQQHERHDPESIHGDASDAKKWNHLYRKLHLKHHGKRGKEETDALMHYQDHQNHGQEHDTNNRCSQHNEQHQQNSDTYHHQQPKKQRHQNLGNHLQQEQQQLLHYQNHVLHQHHHEEQQQQQQQQKQQKQKEEEEEEDRISENHRRLRRSKRKSSSDLMEESSASHNHGRRGSTSIRWSLKRRKLVAASSELPEKICSIVGNGSALVKYSEDPHVEFWESMIEMIVGNGLWDMGNLEFLLYCYLSLNEPHLHETIHKSFIQVLKDLQRTSPFQGSAKV